MVLGNTERVSILVAALEASYRALAAAAARAQGVCLWSLGLALAGAAWLAHGDAILATDQAVIIAVAVLAAWFALRFVFLADLRKSFVAQRKVASGLEDLLGFYAPRRFGPEAEAVFPDSWRAAGKKAGSPFGSAAPLIDVGLIMLLIAIASRSDWIRAWAGHWLRTAGI